MDKLQEIESFARELVNEYLPDYTFKIVDSKQFLGQCSYTKKEIRLERKHALKSSEASVLDTILHEIAHGLTPYNGHNKKWQAKCIEVGAIPRRYGLGWSDKEGNTWEKYCPNNCSSSKYKRKPKYKLAKCENCDEILRIKRIYE